MQKQVVGRFKNYEEYVKMRTDKNYPNREAILREMNTPKFNYRKGYVFVSEEYLWNNRNHKYKYLI